MDWQNSNYIKGQRLETFVGVVKRGGGDRHICYVVYIPFRGWASTAWRKCKTRKEAEEEWRRKMGVAPDAEVPFRDESYERPVEKRRRTGRG